MREIKFRVWDKNKKLFIPEDTYAIINRTSFGAFGVMLTDWEDYKEGEYFYDRAQELVLYSGLHDKNVKEIYEGDVFGNQYTRGVVVREDNGMFVVRFLDERVKPKPITDPIIGRSAVVGNIYENPELLNS